MAEQEVRRCKYEDMIGFAESHHVTICVGYNDKWRYAVDRILICNSSQLAKEALGRGGTCKEMKLKNVDAPMIKIYLHWLYTGVLGTKNKDAEYEFGKLTSLFFLGIKLEDTKFRNDIITAMVQMGQEGAKDRLPGKGCIARAYSGNEDGSAEKVVQLRKAIVEMYARSPGGLGLFEEIKDSVKPAFAVELCARVMQLRAEEATSIEDMKASEFHDIVGTGDDGEGEPATKRRREE